jgi:heterodisulfide reductase subunit A-like polyferredoxin
MIKLLDGNLCLKCKICEKLCPVDAINVFEYKFVIRQTICIGCGICIEKCPKGILSYDYDIVRFKEDINESIS